MLNKSILKDQSSSNSTIQPNIHPFIHSLRCENYFIQKILNVDTFSPWNISLVCVCVPTHIQTLVVEMLLFGAYTKITVFFIYFRSWWLEVEHKFVS